MEETLLFLVDSVLFACFCKSVVMIIADIIFKYNQDFARRPLLLARKPENAECKDADGREVSFSDSLHSSVVSHGTCFQ